MKRKNTNRLPDDQRKLLQAMIDRDGLEVTRKKLNISRHAMERAVLGASIQAGTAALLGNQLQGDRA
jgi:Flp pilus assembly CpaE family ATPase